MKIIDLNFRFRQTRSLNILYEATTKGKQDINHCFSTWAIKRLWTTIYNRRGGDGHWRDTLRGATDWKRLRNADINYYKNVSVHSGQTHLPEISSGSSISKHRKWCQ